MTVWPLRQRRPIGLDAPPCLFGLTHHRTHCSRLVGRSDAVAVEIPPHPVSREFPLLNADLADDLQRASQPGLVGITLDAADGLVATAGTLGGIEQALRRIVGFIVTTLHLPEVLILRWTGVIEPVTLIVLAA